MLTRSLRLEQPGPLTPDRLQGAHLPVALPAGHELRLRVTACAVCRTDLQLVEGDLAAHRLPIVPGHQAVGVVEAIGPEVAGWQIGDRAGVGWLAGTDGTCAACRHGRENLCVGAAFTGWDRDGGYAQQVYVLADFALHLPAGYDDLRAAPLLCGGVIGYRALKVSGIEPGGRLGLFGFGASARLALPVARHWGCEVYVWTRAPAEQRRAAELGAAWVGGYGDRAPARLDAAVTFAPVGVVVVQALEALERGGSVAINAIHLDGIPAFDYGSLWWERSVRSVANYTRQDAREFLELAARIDLRPDIERFPLDRAWEALARLKAGTLSGTAILEPGP
ncbi:MAG: zinc-binding alcohol dehydrogenase family protein [Candidatus Limnocylindrales bacterium]